MGVEIFMIKNFVLAGILCVVISNTGCGVPMEEKEYIPLRTNKELESQFQIQNNEFETLQEEYNALVKDYKNLKISYDSMKEELSKFEQEDKAWVEDKKFKWIYTEQWDKIIISKTYEANNQYEISDEKFLQGKLYEPLFYPMRLGKEQNGMPSDASQYTYQFIKEDTSYDVQIIGRGEIEIDGSVYSVDSNIHNLGKAFLAVPSYLKQSDPLGKIAGSGILLGEKQLKSPVFDSSVMRRIALSLYNGVQSKTIEKLYYAPRDVGNAAENITFYYYGEEIQMDVYEEYIRIVDEGNQYWYHWNTENKILEILLKL